MYTTTSTPTTRRDLATLGFSATEIERLTALRAGYDRHREYFESNAEYERLNFLKWRYQRGELRELTID
jgi:hypothetical protein